MKKNKVLRRITNFLLLVILLLGIFPAASKQIHAIDGAGSLQGAAITIGIKHNRGDVSNFYNGERVTIDIDITGIAISANDTYSVSLPIDNTVLQNGGDFTYFINIESTPVNVTVDGTVVGVATYNSQTHAIDITFLAPITELNVAKVALGANLAIKESQTTSSQELSFTVSKGGQSTIITKEIPTTSKGFVVTPSLSKTTEVGQYTTVVLSFNWQAQSGLGLGDYFEVTVPEYIDQDLSISITFLDVEGKQVDLKDSSHTYGTATLNKAKSGQPTKISCDFNKEGSTQINISGSVQLTGSYKLETIGELETLPQESEFIVYVNGVGYEYPIGIKPPNFSDKQNKLYKPSQTGVEILEGSANADKGFYQYKWGVSVNNEGLPTVSSTPTGLTMHNVKVTDTVVGPGHYIDRSSIYLICIEDVSLLNERQYKKIADWLPGFTGTADRDTIFLDEFLSLTGANFTPELYGDKSDENKLQSFTIELGDLEGVAIYIGYYAYIEDGSNAQIPSFKDYFFQSFMNGSGASNLYNSDKYFNKAKLNYDAMEVPEITSKLALTSMKSDMTSGILNLNLHKMNENNEPQKGVTFTLYWTGGSKAYTTDENGNIAIPNIGTGNYKLEETTPISGYEAMEPVYFKVPAIVEEPYQSSPYIDLTDNDTFNSSVRLPNNHLVFNTTTKENTIINYPEGSILTGNIKLYKVDAENQNKVLPDAEFILYYMDNNVKYYYCEDGDSISWQTNQETAKIFKTDTDGTIEILDLPYYSYYLEEVAAPAGYILDNTPRLVTINNQNQSIECTVTNAPTKITDPIVPPNPKPDPELSKPETPKLQPDLKLPNTIIVNEERPSVKPTISKVQTNDSVAIDYWLIIGSTSFVIWMAIWYRKYKTRKYN